MCFEIPVEAKAEPAVGFPAGWLFYFAEEKRITPSRYEGIPSLWILSPGGKPYRSAEAAVGHTGLADGDTIVRDFYKHVGLSSIGHAREAQSQVATREVTKSQSSLSKYQIEGARVYCTTEKQWGIIEKKFQLGKDTFQYSVRTQ